MLSSSEVVVQEGNEMSREKHGAVLFDCLVPTASVMPTGTQSRFSWVDGSAREPREGDSTVGFVIMPSL